MKIRKIQLRLRKKSDVHITNEEQNLWWVEICRNFHKNSNTLVGVIFCEYLRLNRKLMVLKTSPASKMPFQSQSGFFDIICLFIRGWAKISDKSLLDCLINSEWKDFIVEGVKVAVKTFSKLSFNSPVNLKWKGLKKN